MHGRVACMAGMCVAGGMHGRGACMAGGMHGGGVCSGQMATEVGGMHPTGMRSCLAIA